MAAQDTVLFQDNHPRTEGSAKLRENCFAYLQRSNRPEAIQVSQWMNRWFDGLPCHAKPGLRVGSWPVTLPRFNDALFELKVHQVLRTLGLCVEIEPELRGTDEKIDFFAYPGNCKEKSFYLEATEAGFGQGSRLMARDPARFNDALFELKVHQVLRTLGLCVEIEPELRGTDEKIDFFAYPGNCKEKSFYLEATEAGFGQGNLLSSTDEYNAVEKLRQHILNPHSDLWLEADGTLSQTLNAQRVARPFLELLKKYSSEDVLQIASSEQHWNLPYAEFTVPVTENKRKNGAERTASTSASSIWHRTGYWPKPWRCLQCVDIPAHFAGGQGREVAPIRL